MRDGRITDGVRMLPVLYEFPEAMQTDEDKPWRDPKNWPMVLPNLGRSITVDRLVADYQDRPARRARRRSGAGRRSISMSRSAWRCMPIAGAAPITGSVPPTRSLTLDALLERSEVVTIGIDGGGLDDLLGLAVLGRCKVTRDWLLWTHAWCQEDVLELRKDIAERLTDFERAGDLTLCSDRHRRTCSGVADIVERICEAGLLPEKDGIGLDPAGVTHAGR